MQLGETGIWFCFAVIYKTDSESGCSGEQNMDYRCFELFFILLGSIIWWKRRIFWVVIKDRDTQEFVKISRQACQILCWIVAFGIVPYGLSRGNHNVKGGKERHISLLSRLMLEIIQVIKGLGNKVKCKRIKIMINPNMHLIAKENGFSVPYVPPHSA